MTPIFTHRIPEYEVWKAERERVAAREEARLNRPLSWHLWESAKVALIAIVAVSVIILCAAVSPERGHSPSPAVSSPLDHQSTKEGASR